MIRDSAKLLTEEAEMSNYKIVEQVTLGINNMLDDIKWPLYVLSRNQSVIDMMLYYNDMSMEEKLNYNREIDEISSSVSQYNPIIKDILILGKNGYRENLKTAKSIDSDYDFTSQPWFIQSIENKDLRIINLGLHEQDYYIDRYGDNKEKTLAIAIPVHNYTGEVVGSIISTLELREIEKLFTLNPYEQGELNLVNKDGIILAHSNTDLIGRRFPIDLDKYTMEENTFKIQDEINGKDFILISKPTTINEWDLIHMVEIDEIIDSTIILQKNHTWILIITLVINISIIILLSVWIYKPIKNLLLNIKSNKTSNLKDKDYKFMELNEINSKYMGLVERVEVLTHKNYESKIALKESELKALYSQINPHVIFNTLQLLQTEIVFGDKKESNQIILSLSNLLRYSMTRTDDLVAIEDELNYIKDYLYIVNKKFNNKLNINIDIPAEILKKKTIKLTLQPIVENSIKHGLKEQYGAITVTGDFYNGGILLSIRDNGVGIHEKDLIRLNNLLSDLKYTQENEHIGLHNVNQRLKNTFGDKYGIRIQSRKNEYTEVMIYIPKSNNRRVNDESTTGR